MQGQHDVFVVANKLQSRKNQDGSTSQLRGSTRIARATDSFWISRARAKSWTVVNCLAESRCPNRFERFQLFDLWMRLVLTIPPTQCPPFSLMDLPIDSWEPDDAMPQAASPYYSRHIVIAKVNTFRQCSQDSSDRITFSLRSGNVCEIARLRRLLRRHDAIDYLSQAIWPLFHTGGGGFIVEFFQDRLTGL